MFNMTGCVIKLQEFKFRLNVNFTTYALIEGMKMTSADWPYVFRFFAKAWFLLAHNYKHAQSGIFDSILDTTEVFNSLTRW